MVFKLKEFTDFNGRYHVLCEDLVGTGKNWIAPARVLNMEVTDFILMLKNDYKAELNFYKKDGKISFVEYSWTDLTMCRKFKNWVNRIAREKNITLERI